MILPLVYSYEAVLRLAEYEKAKKHTGIFTKFCNAYCCTSSSSCAVCDDLSAPESSV